METNTLLGVLKKEVVCSICLEYFKDPVAIHCGHNFCQVCITQCWGKWEADGACPQCRKSSQQRNSTENQHLARIVEIVKCLEVAKALEEDKVCERHLKPLKAFCKDDKIPICMVCSICKDHRRHNLIPREEAAQDYKVMGGSLITQPSISS